MTTPRPEQPPRLVVVDALRGAALLAMIVYHAAWDLSFLGLIATDVATDPGWRLFAQAIAASFLLLVGTSLSLAERAGVGLPRMLRRVAVIAAAAALVSGATYAVLPGQGVYFGILHCIALASLVGIALRRAPWPLLLGLAVLALALPGVAAGPAFNSPAWYWLGLSTAVPPAPDYVPLLPWLAAVLLGMVAGRAVPWPAASGRQPGRTLSALAVAGRHSLAIYLLHQPVLLGLLLAAMPLLGPARPQAERDWKPAWRADCLAEGRSPSACDAELACLAAALAAPPRPGSDAAEAAEACRPPPQPRP
jgi:uncharacterized membrane protein